MRTWFERSGLRALLLVSVVPIAGCAANPEPAPAPIPSVIELAQLQQSGRLDQERLECVLTLAAPMAVEIHESSRLVRDLRRSTAPLGSHAQSVQQGMANSDDADVAARAALNARRSVRAAVARGEHAQAAVFADYASELLAPARDPGALAEELRSASVRGAELDDEEATLFVEYAELRGRVATEGQTADPEGRIPQIEEASPVVMEFYARLLLDLYKGDNVRCAEDGL